MRNSNSLSVVKIARLNKPGRYCDGAGLYLRVSDGLTKSWLFRFERNGHERQMGLGAVHTVSLAEARQRARNARLLVLDGKDPIEVRKAQRAAWQAEAAKAITFEQCAAAYIKAHGPSWRNDKHRAQWEATLKAVAYPAFGKLPVDAIDTTLVLQAIEPIDT
jgi:Arm DNA-binding domain/Phage integrase central domain